MLAPLKIDTFEGKSKNKWTKKRMCKNWRSYEGSAVIVIQFSSENQ